ncbi:MAG: hypothetical protein V5A57_00325 [Candidatus Paceibacterota bacterium]
MDSLYDEGGTNLTVQELCRQTSNEEVRQDIERIVNFLCDQREMYEEEVKKKKVRELLTLDELPSEHKETLKGFDLALNRQKSC